MRSRVLAGIAFALSTIVLVAALFAGLGGGGVSDRAPLPASVDGAAGAEVSDAGTPTVSATGDVESAPSPASVPPGSATASRRGPDVSEGNRSEAGKAAVPDVAPVPVRSGRLDEVRARDLPEPVGLRIDDLEVNAPVEPVGYDAANDLMEVPRSPDLVGWYRFSASPGEPGSAVLAAHVDWNGRAGVFFDLYRLQPGAVVTVVYDDGSEQAFEILGVEQYAKEILPTDEIFARDGEPLLTLITCGGEFDQSARSYEENVVAYGRPIGSAESARSSS